MEILKDAFDCKHFKHPSTAQDRHHMWIDHLLEKVKIVFFIEGRIRFHLNFQGDEILHDYLRREIHKINGAHLKSYSVLTRTALVIYDAQMSTPKTIAEAILRAVQQFSKTHAECELGEAHLHESKGLPFHDHSGHSHGHGHGSGSGHSHAHSGGAHADHGPHGGADCEEECGHDHSAYTTATGIRKEIGKLVLSGGLLAFFLYRRLNNKKLPFLPGPLAMIPTFTTILAGYPIFRGGLDTLKPGKKLTDDSLIGLAVGASLFMGESLTGLSVVWLINLGRLLEAITIRRSRHAIKDLLDLTPQEAWLVSVPKKKKNSMGQLLSKVSVETIKKGQIIRVFASERVPLDGKIIRGIGQLQESYLTGESLPREKTLDDFVYAGSILNAGEIDIEVVNVVQETAVAKMIHAVESLQNRKAAIEKFGAKFASKFVPVSLVLSGTIFLVTRDWRRAITTLVIACPCAAGLATPTAISAAIGRAARKGILIKGGTHLESAAHVDTMVFDKTGTLTTGVPQLATIHLLGQDLTEDMALSLAATTEQHSTHPLARVLLHLAKDKSLDLLPLTQHKVHAGMGISAQIAEDHILVGSFRFMKERKVSVSKKHQSFLKDLHHQQYTTVFLARNQKLEAVFLFEDTLRPEAKNTIDLLRKQGIKRFLLVSGDLKPVAHKIAQLVGIEEVIGEVLPDEKYQIIRRLKSEGCKVAMVGDGVNDAKALVEADISMALASGRCDLAIEAADITIGRDNLELVPETLLIAQKTLRTIKTNFVASIGVNGIGLMLGAQGKLSPFFAAIVHNLSTLAVVLNSFKLRQEIDKELELKFK